MIDQNNPMFPHFQRFIQSAEFQQVTPMIMQAFQRWMQNNGINPTQQMFAPMQNPYMQQQLQPMQTQQQPQQNIVPNPPQGY